MDFETSKVYMRGRSDDDKSVGVVVNDYEHFFYLSKQTPFENAKDAARTLTMIEQGLKTLASGIDKSYNKSFKTPDPKYKSRSCAPRKTFVSDKLVTPYNSIVSGWSFVKDCKTMYGWTPNDYRENALLVYVTKPAFSRLIHQYIESDHFRQYYTRGLRLTDDDFFKRKMLRTFEASLSPELVFRTKYDIWMARWCTVNATSATCISSNTNSLLRKRITCDEYYECSSLDITCDTKRSDNANFVRMAYDIECPGKIKKDGNSRFPVAHWGNAKFTSYAKDVLSLPPPVGPYASPFFIPKNGKRSQNTTNARWGGRGGEEGRNYYRGRGRGEGGRRSGTASTSSSSVTEEESDSVTEEEEEGEEDAFDDNDMLDALMGMAMGSDGGIVGGGEEGGGEDDYEDSEKNATEEEAKIKRHNEWVQSTKDWNEHDWLDWMRWALKKKYSEPGQLENLIKKANLDTFEDLIPDVKDTDRVRCVCAVVKNNNVDVGDNPLDFTKRVAFAYEDPNMVEPIRSRPAEEYGANIWKFPEIDLRCYSNEAEMLNAYLNYRREIGVDIEESWNGRSFDDVYIYDRLIHLQTYGTNEEKRFAFDANFGFLTGDDDVQSKCTQRFSSSKAGGDKLERSVTRPLSIHNDGLQIITNTSFGEKNRLNTLDYIAMIKLVHSRSNAELAIDAMIRDRVVDPSVIRRLYYKERSKEMPASEDEDPPLKEMMKVVFEDVPMRKMQYDINEGMAACMAGGTAFKDFIDYCFVDASLPVLIGGKLSLQIAIARAANVTPSDVFEKGVQLKVLSLLYSTCKKDFEGLYLVPDKGGLWLHWPCMFDDDELGFELAVTSDPRLSETLWCNRSKKIAEAVAAAMTTQEKMEAIEMEEAFSVLNSPGAVSAIKNKTKSAKGKTVPASSRRGGGRKTPPAAKAPKANVPIGKYSGINKKAIDKKEAAKKRAAWAVAAKKLEKKGYTGAYVIDPTHMGAIEEPVSTLDFSSLYPSICYSRGLCFTTFLTSKGIRKWGLERWQYAIHVLGMESEISCGELLVDSQAASEGGYHSKNLKIATFLTSLPLKTLYGKFIKNLKIWRGIAKKVMISAEDSLEDIRVHEKDGTPLSKGSIQEKMVAEGTPLALVKRFLELERDVGDNAQLAFKICNNSGYGFPSVNPAKAILPMMEIGATITANGRGELQYARAVALRVEGTTAKEYATKRAEIIEKESIVDPNDDSKRVSKIDGKDYPLWKIDPKYVISKSGEDRKPLVNCSSLSKVSDAWLHETRHSRISKSSIEVVYGDTDSIMKKWPKGLFDITSLEDVRKACEAARFVGHHINRFEYEEMSIVFEKMCIGMLLKAKKNYIMRLISEVNGKTREYFERGGSVKRDCLPFVKSIIDAHKESILEAMGRGEPLSDVLGDVVKGIKSAVNDLYTGNYAMDDLVLAKKVTKIGYSKEPEHIVVASKNKKRGNPVSIGSAVFYTYEFVPFGEGEFGKYEAYRERMKEFEEAERAFEEGEKQLKYQRGLMSKWTAQGPDLERIACRSDPSDGASFSVYGKSGKRRPAFKRTHKGIDIAEDAEYMKTEGLVLDVNYIFLHRILNPVVSHFAPIFFPCQEMPYVDASRMTPKQVADTVKMQKKLQGEQQEKTRALLFGDFERNMEKERVAICENAYQEYLIRKIAEKKREARMKEEEERKDKRSIMHYFGRQQSSSSSSLDLVATTDAARSISTMEASLSKERFCKCINCHKVEKMLITKGTILFDSNDGNDKVDQSKRTKLPGIICTDCGKNSTEELAKLTAGIRENEELRKQLNHKCTGCIYLLDNPGLDASKCKSSHCVVYQTKRTTEATLEFKKRQSSMFVLTKKRMQMEKRNALLNERRKHVALEESEF